MSRALQLRHAVHTRRVHRQSALVHRQRHRVLVPAVNYLLKAHDGPLVGQQVDTQVPLLIVGVVVEAAPGARRILLG